VPPATSIVVYNGGGNEFPGTVAYLEQTFGVKSVAKTDPAIRADVVVTIGTSTPDLDAPAGP
jgi:hypothetical protein